MKKILYTTTAFVLCGGIVQANAACIATPSCETLGYTQTSCVDNNGVKCPFGNKYFCVCPAKYVYSCSGTGYAGGKGTACGGKYAECACASGYIWSNGSCVQNAAVWGQCTGYAGKNCKIGDILFSDGTCSTNTVSGKTPIAVVVYISDEGCGQALALESVGSYQWGGYGTDISDLTNYMAEHEAEQDYASCKNSQIIMAAGDKNTYPAVWAANEYSTEGTRAGDWCLPAAGIFSSYRYNQTSINISFKKINGMQFATNTFAWSSSEYKLTVAWYSDFNSIYGIRLNEKNYSHEVRPVIEF